MKRALYILLASAFIFNLSGAQELSSPLPHAANNFNLSYIQVSNLMQMIFFFFPQFNQLINFCILNIVVVVFFFFFGGFLQKNEASCSYSVVITTSCSSSKYTRDQISIAFGDAYGNQVCSFLFIFNSNIPVLNQISYCILLDRYLTKKLWL